MLYKQFLELFDILDSASASGAQVVEYFKSIVPDCKVETYPLNGPKGHTDMVRLMVPGKNGKTNGGTAKTLGILGRLGGLGARPERIGFVSDGDGALVALARSFWICRRRGISWRETSLFLPMYAPTLRPRLMIRCRL